MSTREDLITITSKLIGFPTCTPDGNEYLCKDYLVHLMTGIGMKVAVVAKTKLRTNVVGEIGQGKKSLVIACHMDTANVGTGWKTDPFKAVVKADKIYGRGATDDKGPFAVSFCAVKDFVKSYPNFDGKILLVALADEEADNIYGVKYLLARGFRADAGLIPDGGYFTQLDIGEKGCVQAKIESFGTQAHSALHENGDNAISHLTALIENIKRIHWPVKFDKRFTSVSTNLSIVRGGEYPNSVAPYAFVQMDIRFPMGMSSKEVLTTIESVITKTVGKFKTSVIYTTEPHIVSDTKLVSTFLAAAKRQKIKMKAITLAGNSVGKEFNEAGIPSIVHYPMNELPIHEPNEYIQIDLMMKTKLLYEEFLKHYFGV